MDSFLPTNVSVLSLADLSTYGNLENATFFTRLHVRNTRAEMVQALEKIPAVKQTWCFAHQNIILVFDIEEETHADHVRAVLQMFIRNRCKADIKGCIFDVPDAAKAGFRIDVVGTGDKRAPMIVDTACLQQRQVQADTE